MIINQTHFNPKDTQEWFILWLKIEGYQVGDVVPDYEYMLWNSTQWRKFKLANGYSENCYLHQIDNWKARFSAFLEAQLPVTNEQLSLFEQAV